jgi:hypothetical protein
MSPPALENDSRPLYSSGKARRHTVGLSQKERDAMMGHEEFRQLLRQKPFQPFRVIVNDGRTYEVRFPEMNLVAHSFVKIGIPEAGVPHPICDHTEFVRLSQIVRVEPLVSSTPAIPS